MLLTNSPSFNFRPAALPDLPTDAAFKFVKAMTEPKMQITGESF